MSKMKQDKVKPVRKSPSIKKQSKNNSKKVKKIEVRNEHARTQASKKKSIKIKMKKRPRKEVMIYDEPKYYKNLSKHARKVSKYVIGLYLILFALSLISVVKLEVTHTRNGYNLGDIANDKYQEKTNIESKRGTIYDSSGDALAINLEVYDLKIITSPDFQYIKEGGSGYETYPINVDATEMGTEIAKTLGHDEPEASQYIADRIQTGIDDEKYEVQIGKYGKNITLSERNELEKLDYPWLEFEEKDMRFYPYGDFASYILGYTTTDENGEINGELGVEKALDGHLKGQDGTQISSFDNYGIELSDAQKQVIPKIDGTDVYLTLDTVIQTYLESSMEKALNEENVKDTEYDGIFTIVMDVDSGNILAAQSYPSFDPNKRDIENYTNYFTNYCFEPGSTFKTATIAAAYESGVWNDTITEPTGSRSASTWGGATIQDWNNGAGWGSLTWKEGYYMSSNTVMTYIMDSIDKEYWDDFIQNKLLIGKPVKTQFFETPSCDYSPQYDLEYATASFGQGITVNVLQLLRMYSGLINDGKLVTPHIVSEIKDADTGETIYSDEDLESQDDVVSPETSEFVREMLRGVVTYDNGVIQGTGEKYQGSTYDIGMKTGTAQIAGDNGQYEKDKYLYSSIALAPVEDPQLLVYTAVIRPTTEFISYQAFPQYVKEVFDNSLSYLNSENEKIDINNEVDKYSVKNYTGKQMEEISNSGQIVKIGTGKVDYQYPKAGQKIAASQKVILVGNKDATMPDIKGYTYNETVAVCNALQVTCEFENTGTVV